MTDNLSLEARIQDESAEIAVHSEFSVEDALWSLERGLKFFKDCEGDEESAWESARDFVASGVLLARRLGFGLPEAVEYMIFSQNHRAHSVCESYLPPEKGSV